MRAGRHGGERAVVAACPSGRVAGLRAEALAVRLEAALAHSYPVLGEPPRDAGPAGSRGGGRASANMAGLRGEDKMALAQGPPLPHALGAPRPLPETGRSPSPRLRAFLELPGRDPHGAPRLLAHECLVLGNVFTTPPPRGSPTDQYKLYGHPFCSNSEAPGPPRNHPSKASLELKVPSLGNGLALVTTDIVFLLGRFRLDNDVVL